MSKNVVERTILDDAYDAYWNHLRSVPPTDDLLSAVRLFTLRVTGWDEDVAQTVCLLVYQGLDTFRRADETAFTRWVRTIIKRTRLEAFHTDSMHTKTYDESTLSVHDDAKYVDLSRLPDDVKLIANKLLEGYSLTEIAASQNKTPAAIRNKLARFRKSPLRNAA